MGAVAASSPPTNALPADWTQRLRRCLLTQPDHREPPAATLEEESRYAAVRALYTGEWRAAAVLVPVVARGADSTVLLTQRDEQLRSHAGQISFPGGRMDAAENEVAAALRETEEETGIGARFVQPLGYLPDHHVLTGYRITPVVALLQPGFALQPHAPEVAEIFELPLSLVLDERSYVPVERIVQQIRVPSLDLPFGQYQIWGATAAMLRTLCVRFHAAAGP
jgi:8-oxo-dGTP pyrophosphatase MutT (NUDIX family)